MKRVNKYSKYNVPNMGTNEIWAEKIQQIFAKT